MLGVGTKILVDSSIWIAILRGTPPWNEERSLNLLTNFNLLLGDLIYVELMRGVSNQDQANLLRAKMLDFEKVSLVNQTVIDTAVSNHMHLRSKGISIRGTVDLLIATWCQINGVSLLHSDRDFDHFETHLDLVVWRG